ncbi:MAG: LysE family transporter [Chloroflexi bacterium]|nr:LysE family transporter [Chloroflexota bacterium]
MPALAIFGTSFLVGLSGAASPGPLLAFNIRETVRRGVLAGPYVAAGHSLLELLVVVALAFGLTRWVDSDPVVAAIGLLGGLFLLWMGWSMIRNPGQGAPQLGTQVDSAKERGIKEPFIGGILVSLSNPYWAIWWITVGAAFMTKSLKLGAVGVIAFYLGHILSDISWYSLVSAALASGRRFLTARVYRGVMLGCGFFLLAMGVYFIATGAATLAG